MSAIEVQLCTQIVADSFGRHVADVCRHLLVHGRATLVMLHRALVLKNGRTGREIQPLRVQLEPQLTGRRIREALFILLQHYLVTFADEVDGSQVATYYAADPAAIVDRIALPIYAQIIHSELGPAEADIYLRILYHGRTTPDYLLNNEVSPDDTKLTLKCFGTLLKGNWITSVSDKDGLTQQDEEMKEIRQEMNRVNNGIPVSLAEAKKIRAQVAIKRSMEQSDSDRQDSSILGRNAENKAFMFKKRRTEDIFFDNDGMDIKEEPDTKEVDDISQYDDLIEAMEAHKSVFFRYNPVRMRDRIRNVYIEELTLERFNKGASYVIRTLLRLGEQGSKVNGRRSTFNGTVMNMANPSSLIGKSTNNIVVVNPSRQVLADRNCFIEPISELSLGASLTDDERSMLLIAETSTTLKTVSDPLKEYLNYVSNDLRYGILVHCREISARHWSVNIVRAKQLIRQRFIESVIEERFGESCKRVFRILLDREKLTESQIAKTALMDPKSVRYCLYLMHNAGLAFIQDVPKTLDHAAARTYFLWYVSLEKAMKTFLLNCYKTLFNIRSRRNHEISQQRDLLDKSMRAEAIAQQTGNEAASKLTDHELKTLENLNASVKMLTASELRVMKLLIAIN